MEMFHAVLNFVEMIVCISILHEFVSTKQRNYKKEIRIRFFAYVINMVQAIICRVLHMSMIMDFILAMLWLVDIYNRYCKMQNEYAENNDEQKRDEQ